MIALMEGCMRWYGPEDRVTLAHIRQSGATGIYTSLHQIPYGNIWTRKAIRERKEVIDNAGMSWTAVESLPVHEQIKTRTGDYQTYVNNYKTSLRNLAAEGIRLVVYNFMPVLDWVRTDMAYTLKDGSQCLHFDPIKFAAFELFLLKRQGAAGEYSKKQLNAAEHFFTSLSASEKISFEKQLPMSFPAASSVYRLMTCERCWNNTKTSMSLALKITWAFFSKKSSLSLGTKVSDWLSIPTIRPIQSWAAADYVL